MIRNRKYMANKKNGGVIPYMRDPRMWDVPIGCGNCIECRKQKSREWQVRLLEHIKTNTNGKFITLTFSTENFDKIRTMRPTKKWLGCENLTGYDLDNEVATRSMHLFLERWRRAWKKSVQHWFVTELGHQGTENIHLHGLIWTDKKVNEVEKHWQYGYVWKGKKERVWIPEQKGFGVVDTNYVNDQTVGYVTKYVTKRDEDHPGFKSKILTSPGIGRNYTLTYDAGKNVFNGEHTIETYRNKQGYKIGLPVYWRNKIYTEEQREELWLQKLNKPEKWVLGNRIDIRHDMKCYEEAIRAARLTSKRLGYGSDQKSWEQDFYERERRIQVQKERLARMHRRQKAGC